MAHIHDPENPTRTFLDPRVPYVTELDLDGGWPLDRWKATRAMTVEFPVSTPFDPDNTVTRVLPSGKRIHQALFRRYVLKEGEEIEVPRVWRRSIRATQCKHTACLQHPHECTRDDHAAFSEVIGGVGPFLGLVGEVNPMPVAPSIAEHPSNAPSQRLVDAIQPPRQASPDEAALERARARRAGGGQ
jgi:hypothetical protein